ncbi:MAG TPA: peptidylprolyl isomerase [Candidatus Baltobacteraceae bacterium]|nr:peptidylprolyl isomerase [Candidatus Baltobacteraceae bacterium]
MTSRPKSVKTKPRRPAWDSERRLQVVVTITFVGIIVLGLLILGGVVALSYYNAHLLAVATVGGKPISRDQWLDRVNVLTFRLNTSEGRLREAVAAGELDAATEQQEVSQLEQSRTALPDQALQGLIDDTFLAQVAAPFDITISAADIDAQVQQDASQPEQRRATVLTFAPSVDVVSGLPSDAQKAAALANAQKALADLQAGKDINAVATADGADDSGAQDYGYITSQDTSDDPNLVQAIFSLPKAGYTGVVTGQDGSYRVAQVTDIRPAAPDSTFMSTLTQYTSLDAYRAAVRGELLQQKVTAKVSADALASDVEQVRGYEIQLATATDQTTGQSDGTEAKVDAMHILYSPNGDASSATSLAASDPAWAAAEAKANATAAKLRAITDLSTRRAQFQAIAKTDSDDTGSATAGGELGFQTEDSFVPEFGGAIFNGTHTYGEIIGPIKSEYGYHVIFWEALHAPAATRINDLANQLKQHQPGVTFQALAVADSDAPDASQGGDMGWIAKGQSADYHTEEALFGLQPGGVSSPVDLSDGFYLYSISAIAQRPPFGAQVSSIRANAFTDWYQPLKDAASSTITTDPSMTNVILAGQGSQ